VVLNQLAEGSQIQTNDFLREPHKKYYHKSIDMFCFIAPTQSVTQNIRDFTERRCLLQGILSQQRIRHLTLTEYIFFLRINSYSKRISSYLNRIS